MALNGLHSAHHSLIHTPYGGECCSRVLQLNSSTSVASEFYFRSRLLCLSDSEPAAVVSVASQATPGVGVGEVMMEKAVAVDLALIVLWKVST